MRTAVLLALVLAPAAVRAQLPAAPDVLPTVLRSVPPLYPDSARAARLEGRVLVQLLVGEDGRVAEARVAQADHAVFAAPALAAAQAWTFRPARKDGRPVATWVVLPVRFALGAAPDATGALPGARPDQTYRMSPDDPEGDLVQLLGGGGAVYTATGRPAALGLALALRYPSRWITTAGGAATLLQTFSSPGDGVRAQLLVSEADPAGLDALLADSAAAPALLQRVLGERYVDGAVVRVGAARWVRVLNHVRAGEGETGDHVRCAIYSTVVAARTVTLAGCVRGADDPRDRFARGLPVVDAMARSLTVGAAG